MISTLYLPVPAILLFMLFACATARAIDLPNDVGPNLALGKSHQTDDPNQYGFDTGLTDGDWKTGKGTTFATDRTPKFPKHVTIDLEKTYRIAYVLTGTPRIGWTKTVEVSVSIDGRKFETVGAHDFKLGVDNNHIYEFKPLNARFVRMTFMGNYERPAQSTLPYSPYFCFLNEVEIFGPRGSGPTVREKINQAERAKDNAPAVASAPAATKLPDNVGPNLALGKPHMTTDTNQYGWDSGLTDGDWTSGKGTTFATDRSNTFPKHVVIDLEKTTTVAYVLAGVPKFGWTKTVELSVSADGHKFETVGTHDFKMDVDNDYLYQFKPATARYVRLTFTGNHERPSTSKRPFSAEFCFLNEVEVFGPQGSGPTVRGQINQQEEFEKRLALEHLSAITVKLPANLGPNLALSKPYICSDRNASWDRGLTDGFWFMRIGHTFATGLSDKFPKTVTIDLRTSAMVTHVHLGVPYFGSTKTISVSVSYDGKKFAEVGSHDFAQGKPGSHLYNFPPTLTRFVRLSYMNNHSEKLVYDPPYCFTTEVEVYAQPQ